MRANDQRGQNRHDPFNDDLGRFETGVDVGGGSFHSYSDGSMISNSGTASSSEIISWVSRMAPL